MFTPIKRLVDYYSQGKMVILIDDENRENEGDLLTAASTITAEQINFMATHARGLICLTLPEAVCENLRLPLMSRQQDDENSTNFTISIEAAKDVTTGISAADRAKTVQTAVAENAVAEDLITPGHIFPLRARLGGVLVRAGHTEAGCDLAQLAKMPVASSVIVEIMNEDGSMARLPDLVKFSKQHDIPLGTIADLIHYRLQNEQLITPLNQQQIQTQWGEFTLRSFYDQIDHVVHYSLTYGEVDTKQTNWVRVQVQNYISDILDLSPQAQSSSWTANSSLEFFAKQKNGTLVLLNTFKKSFKNNPEQQAPLPLQQPVQASQSLNTSSNSSSNASPMFDNRNFGKGAQILHQLGLKKINVLGSHSNYRGISGFDIELEQIFSRSEIAKLNPTSN